MIAEVSIEKKSNKKVAIEQSYWDLSKTYSFDEYFKLEEKAPFKSR